MKPLAEFGTKPAVDRASAIREMAFTGLQLSRDLGCGSMGLICKRVLSALRMGRSPRLGDVRSIAQFTNAAFR